MAANGMNPESDLRYKEALDYLFSQLPMFSRVGAPAYKPGLEMTLKLDEYFDSPHEKFKSIHIAGTNGKGSVSHMLASVLQAQGYKTALYTSPHLVDFRERIKINGKMIPKEEVVTFTNKWKEGNFDGHPSFFELTMMLAFQWFAKEKVDIAVIEVGMGGRLDSTNIIKPELSVITNISKDHTQFLGNSLAEIAAEKAGIIKKEIPVVIGETLPETRQVFQAAAEAKDAEIIFAEDNKDKLEISSDGKGWYGNYKNREKNLNIGVEINLAGDYQKANILTLLTAVEELKKLGWVKNEEAIENGLKTVIQSTGFQGRWTILNDRPLIIGDTGHNVAGVSYNMNQLKQLIGDKKDSKLQIVIGFVADKAIDDIINILPADARYYLTNASIPRALPVNELANKFEGKKLNFKSFPDVKSAYKAALSDSTKNDIIFIGGSTFIVADLFSHLQDS